MAEPLLTSATKAILNGLISLATQQISLAWGFEKDLEKLRRRLTIIQALLQDAERKRILSEPLKIWLKSLKAGTCHAENVLDELAYEALRRKIEVPNPLKEKVHNLAFRFKMAEKVNDVNLLLKEICNEAVDIGLSPANLLADASSVETREFRQTHPFIDDLNVVGRDGDVSTVIDMLLGSDEEDNFSVIAIEGMAGLGKTTLAQLVYNDEKVVAKFGDKRMWICVSDDFRVERILNEMVQSLTGDKSETPNIQGIVRKLNEKLGGDKYLLVLDDVWNEDQQEWVRMRDCLIEIGGSKGSKILVTTRKMDVLSTMQISSSLTHHLDKLSNDECWAMFTKRVFSSGGPIRKQSLENIGRRMVEKCKGVPLAVNSIGGLLYAKHSEREWESVDKSEIWRSLESENSILPVLRLSYDHLPSPSLKRCFAYCSVFPKDTNINKDMLIHLWMGLGYLHPIVESALEMEDLGNDYFNILLRNSFFQEAKLDEFNNITSCMMHDLVHDLALQVAAGSCLTLEASEVKNHPEVQHLTLLLGKETRLDIPQEKVGNLRSLFLTGYLPQKTDFVKCVRVLRLEGSYVQELRKFIHLRYLDLSHTRFEKLPNFITSLYNLETLVLPSSLQELPKDFHKLVSLRHLCMDERKISPKVIPAKLGHLTSLQTLPLFVLGVDVGHKIEELRSLKHLRGRLRVNNLMFVNDREEAKKANMIGKKDVQELVFHFGLERSHTNHVDVLEGLQPHKNLKGLILEEFGGQKFASWMTSANPEFLQNLVKIELRSCLVCEQVPTLGHLRHLEVIKMKGLDNLKRIGTEFYGLDEGIVGSSSKSGTTRGGVVFPALRTLSLGDMPKLEEWSDVSSLPAASTSVIKFFPCLKLWLISNCPQLVTIPGQLLSVQSISISTVDPCWSEGRMMDSPSLLMEVNENSENIALFLEDLLGKSSRTLRNLEIDGLKKLDCLPNQLLNLTSHEKLVIECSILIYIIEEKEVTISTGLPSLQQLSILDCPQLRCLPKGLLQPTLADFCIEWCGSLECDESCSLTSLKKMTIIGCSRLGSFWEKGLVCLTSLQRLVIGGFSGHFLHFPWPSYPPQQCPFISLEYLRLKGWGNLTCLPDLEHLTALKTLEIWEWGKLEALPEWLGNLSSLQSLEIWSCPNLKSLPSREAIQRLANLQHLFISRCPILADRIEKGSGEEWHKIAYTPLVQIRHGYGARCKYRYSQKELNQF
ncbi:putative disease resistance protein RGA1 [Rhododendron vialii]|uniref:putative disease resistance protein RGA1 n=1 Tax=Rhododendron vialii TaxID=182163 RepID=UPI00265F2A21|nr:putative disease resistance protein RGA1 [Rhododendron vialii]